MVLKGYRCLNLVRSQKIVPRGRKMTQGSIRNWLFKAFGLNGEQHELSIMVVINRTEVVFQELMPLEGTNNWRDYVNIATHGGLAPALFIQALEKVGSSKVQEEVQTRQDTTQEDPTKDSTETIHGPNGHE